MVRQILLQVRAEAVLDRGLQWMRGDIRARGLPRQKIIHRVRYTPMLA